MSDICSGFSLVTAIHSAPLVLMHNQPVPEILYSIFIAAPLEETLYIRLPRIWRHSGGNTQCHQILAKHTRGNYEGNNQ
jgi:hypothetical protein